VNECVLTDMRITVITIIKSYDISTVSSYGLNGRFHFFIASVIHRNM
jgi:hypothetical protein